MRSCKIQILSILGAFLLLTSIIAQASQLPMPKEEPPLPRELPRPPHDLWKIKKVHNFYRMAEGLFHERGELLSNCTVVQQTLLFENPNNRNIATLYLKPKHYGFCAQEILLPPVKTVSVVRAGLRAMGETERWVGFTSGGNISSPFAEKYELLIEEYRGRGTLFINSVFTYYSHNQVFDLIFPQVHRFPTGPIERD